MKEVIFALLIASASVSAAGVDYSNRLLLPHIYPGQTITSSPHWGKEPLHVGSSTVRWTDIGAYSINVDKIHLYRKSYTFILKSRWGPEIRFIPFNTTEIIIGNMRYDIRFDKQNYLIWLDNYGDKINGTGI